MRYISTATGITFYANGGPQFISTEAPFFQLIKESLAKGFDDALLAHGDLKAFLEKRSQNSLSISGLKGFSGSVLNVKGQAYPGEYKNYAVEWYLRQLPSEPLNKFFTKLGLNFSRSSKNLLDLYNTLYPFCLNQEGNLITGFYFLSADYSVRAIDKTLVAGEIYSTLKGLDIISDYDSLPLERVVPNKASFTALLEIDPRFIDPFNEAVYFKVLEIKPSKECSLLGYLFN